MPRSLTLRRIFPGLAVGPVILFLKIFFGKSTFEFISMDMSSNASQLRLTPQTMGMVNASSPPIGAIDTANRLLQRNHDEFHITWNDAGLHNHIAHALLTLYSLGANSEQLQRAFDDGQEIQRPRPSYSEGSDVQLSDPDIFYGALGRQENYRDYLDFFTKAIERDGWKRIVNKYCFERGRIADELFARLFSGGYHPLIHLGFGIEFEQPAIIAEALAECAIHDEGAGRAFLNSAEVMASAGWTFESPPEVSLAKLIDSIHATDELRTAARWEDPNKMQSVFDRVGTKMEIVAVLFQVRPDTLKRKEAEMISACAYFTGAAQRADNAIKMDFFYMHDVTSSIFVSVILAQDWISDSAKVRLLEWKGRLDLAWYASRGAPRLNIDAINDYQPTMSAGMDWPDLYQAVNSMHDDGHVAKIIRAFKNGEEVCARFAELEGTPAFPVRGAAWLKLAQMAYDSTVNTEPDGEIPKWVMNAGFDQAWDKVPRRAKL